MRNVNINNIKSERQIIKIGFLKYNPPPLDNTKFPK